MFNLRYYPELPGTYVVEYHSKCWHIDAISVRYLLDATRLLKDGKGWLINSSVGDVICSFESAIDLPNSHPELFI